MNNSIYFQWLLCPICKSKTRVKIREDTILKNFPLYCLKYPKSATRWFCKERAIGRKIYRLQNRSRKF